MPSASWSYYQEWNDALFMHWKVDKRLLQEYIPLSLELDLFEGEAWISIVVFKMERIRPHYLPSWSLISNFNEVNIRTYVKKGAKSGVYFLSIEAAKRLSCAIAKYISGLPYRYSEMNRQATTIECTNSSFQETLKVNFSISKDKHSKDSLDFWLTERYALFLVIKYKTYRYEIHHREWPIYNAQTMELQVDYFRFRQLFQGVPQRTHYSPGVQVLSWSREQV